MRREAPVQKCPAKVMSAGCVMGAVADRGTVPAGMALFGTAFLSPVRGCLRSEGSSGERSKRVRWQVPMNGAARPVLAGDGHRPGIHDQEGGVSWGRILTNRFRSLRMGNSAWTTSMGGW